MKIFVPKTKDPIHGMNLACDFMRYMKTVNILILVTISVFLISIGVAHSMPSLYSSNSSLGNERIAPNNSYSITRDSSNESSGSNAKNSGKNNNSNSSRSDRDSGKDSSDDYSSDSSSNHGGTGPSLTLNIDGGFYDTTTETWTTNSDSFSLELIAGNGGKENKLYGVNLVISVGGTESEMESGTISLDGGLTTISSSAFSFGTPQFSLAKEGTSEYPSHDVYDTWFATQEVNGGDEFTLPQTFAYDIVVTGFSWVHFDAFGYYNVATGKKGGNKIHSEFAPPSEDASYISDASVAAEAMAVPEPSTFILLALGLIVFAFARTTVFRKKLQLIKTFLPNKKG